MNAKACVLVTGASGFLGSSLVRCLLDEGMNVRALVRPTSRRDLLDGLDVETVEGDLRERESLRAALRGAEFLFHAAADYRLWARDPRELFQTNVEGTRTLMEEARRAGTGRIVYTSSVATLKPRSDGSPASEIDSCAEADAVGAYKRSKIRAEQLVREMAAAGLPVVIVNPSTPVGPRDIRPTPTGRLIVEAARGRMPAYVDTGLNMVHVADVARGHVAALRRGRCGEAYVLGGQDVLLRDLLLAIARQSGRHGPRFRVPHGLVYPVALASEVAARLTGREPLTTLDGLKMSRQRMFFSSAKAASELGYRPRPYQEGLREALQWFREFGYIKGRDGPL